MLGRELGERREGRLEFRGPSATSGYFHNPAKTRELFHDGWLDTGDRAYMAGGDLFITGRIKDIIIRAGQHISSARDRGGGRQPSPACARTASPPSASPIRPPARSASWSWPRPTKASPSAQASLKARAQEVATHIVGGPPDEVVLVQPGTVPKTASGKIRRAAAKDLYLGKNLAVPQRALWWQLARLALRRAGHAHVALAHVAGELLYAAWWWTVIAAASCSAGSP